MQGTSANHLPLDSGSLIRKLVNERLLLSGRRVKVSDLIKLNIPETIIDFLNETKICEIHGEEIGLVSSSDLKLPMSEAHQKSVVSFLSEKGLWKALYDSGALEFDAQEKTRLLIRYNLYPRNLPGLRNLLEAFGTFETNDTNGTTLNISRIVESQIRNEILSYRKPAKRSVSPDQLEKELARKKIYGERAELFVMDFEMMRLKDDDLFSKVIHVALENTAAGYDIQSFSTGEGTTLPRFIEVKSVGDDMAFYLSRNEVRVAEELGNDYFLYLVQRSRTEDETYTPRIIRDPFKKIFRDGDWSFRPDSFKVTPGG
jgi:hypothetical protein